MKIHPKCFSILLFGLILLSSCYNKKKIEKKNYSENIKGYWGKADYPRAIFRILDSTIVYVDTTFFKIPEQQYYIRYDSLFVIDNSDTTIEKIIECNKNSLIISNNFDVVDTLVKFKNDTLR